MSVRYIDRGTVRTIEASDILVERGVKPWLATLWEPITRKVPSPALALAFCCYINTVIFYVRPYTVRELSRWWRDKAGQLRKSEAASFMDWGQFETRLIVESSVWIDGEEFEVGCGRVMWLGRGRGWWMKHPVRRRRREAVNG